MTDEENTPPLSRAQGWSMLLAELDQMKELIEFAGDLPASMPDEEKRERISAHATTVGLSLRGLIEGSLPEAIPAAILDENAEMAAHALVHLWFQGREPRTVWEVISSVEKHLPWTDVVADFALSRAAGDEDARPMELLLDGLIANGVMFSNSDNPVPYVVAASTSKTTRPDHVKAYKKRMREVFDGVANPTGKTLAFIAECIEIRDSADERLSPSQVARELVMREFHSARALTEEQFLADYGDVYEDVHDQVRQALTRDFRRATEAGRFLSQEDD